MDLSLCSLSLQALRLKHLQESMGCQYWSSGEGLLWHFVLVFRLVKPVDSRQPVFCVGSESN